jgi:hypothetical protein
MQVRRGLIFVAIHLAIAIPIIVSLEAANSNAISERYRPKAKLILASQETGETVTFDLCTLTDVFNNKETVIVLTNPLASIPTGWGVPCPAHWTAAGALGLKWPFSPRYAPAQRKVDLLFVLLIALQWFLIGSFPLRPSARILAQPDWFITITSAVAAAIVWIHPIQGFSRLPALLAFCGWLWFVGLLLWRTLKRVGRFFASRTQEQRA